MIAKLLEAKLTDAGIPKNNSFPVAAQVGSCPYPFSIYTPGRIEPVTDLAGDVAYYRADFRVDLYSDDYAGLQTLVHSCEQALKMIQEPFEDTLWVYRCLATVQDGDGFVQTEPCFAKTITGKIEFAEVTADAE